MLKSFVKVAIAVMAVTIAGLLLSVYILPAGNLHVVTNYTLTTLLKTIKLKRLNSTLNKPVIYGEGTWYCQVESPWTDDVVIHKMTSNMVEWTFNKRRKCPVFKISEIPDKRIQVVLHCDSKPPYMATTTRNSSDKIGQVQFGDQCLIDMIAKCCFDENKVPNVAHFVWYAPKELGYFYYLSLMSLLRFMKPCLTLIHGPSAPYGKYWDSFISHTPNIIHVQRKRPDSIFGHRLAFKEHASDVMRIQALQSYGDMYIDYDEVLLRSVDPLRTYEYTQGHETANTLGSQLVIARRNATFLRKWLESYNHDYKKSWNYNALDVPWKIALQHPELIHVEGFNFTRPSWYDADLILNKNYDWSTNYAMHLFIRGYKHPINTEIIRTLNTTIGSVSRHILFGNKELCEKKNQS